MEYRNSSFFPSTVFDLISDHYIYGYKSDERLVEIDIMFLPAGTRIEDV